MIKHNMPFADYAKDQAYSASDLLAFRRSPQLLADIRAGLAPNKETPAMLFGTAAHLSILEPVRYAKTVIARPATYIGKGKKVSDPPELKPWNANSHVCQDFLKMMEDEGKTVLTEDQIVRLTIMQRRMPTEVRELLEYPAEVSVFTELNVNGPLPVRIRPDLLGERQRVIPDLKTINNIEAIEDRVSKLNYHIRSEFYRVVMKAQTGHDYDVLLLFVESNPPYRWRIIELSAEYNMLAEHTVGLLLENLAACHRAGEFKDHGNLRATIGPPPWMGDEEETTTEDEE